MLDLLSPDLRAALAEARNRVGQLAGLDEGELLPAVDRYSGSLYTAAGSSLNEASARGQSILIVSGGYGLLLADEPIGSYDRRFRRSDWPKGLLERCLLAAAETLDQRYALAFCSRTTDYAKLVRATPWMIRQIETMIVSPRSDGKVAMRKVPHSLGLALHNYLSSGTVPSAAGGLGVEVTAASAR